LSKGVYHTTVETVNFSARFLESCLAFAYLGPPSSAEPD
jgi:hypothetical protein